MFLLSPFGCLGILVLLGHVEVYVEAQGQRDAEAERYTNELNNKRSTWLMIADTGLAAPPVSKRFPNSEDNVHAFTSNNKKRQSAFPPPPHPPHPTPPPPASVDAVPERTIVYGHGPGCANVVNWTKEKKIECFGHDN